jgi:hypothetical protein
MDFVGSGKSPKDLPIKHPDAIADDFLTELGFMADFRME